MKPVVATTMAIGSTMANNGHQQFKNRLAMGPHQILMGLQRVAVANPFYYRSVTVGGFWEDGTSLVDSV